MKISSVATTVERQRKYFIIGILTCLFFSGVIYSIMLGDEIRFPDESIYLRLADSITDKHMYALHDEQPYTSRVPGYAMMLAALKYLGSDVFFLRLFNYLCLSLSALFVYLMVLKQASPGAALLGLLFASFYPLSFYTASTLYPQTVASTLLLGICYIYWCVESIGIWKYVIMGLLFGIVILTVPTFIFVFFILCCWHFFSGSKKKIREIAVMTLMVSMIIAPWTIRNYSITDRIVLLTTTAGRHLILHTPRPGIDSVEEFKNLDESELDRVLLKEAVTFVLEEMPLALKLYANNFIYYFDYKSFLVTKKESTKERWALSLMTYGPLLLILIVRILAIPIRRLSRFELFMIVIFVMNGFFSAFFFVKIRYRVPFDFLLIMLAVIFLDHVARVMNERWVRLRSAVDDERLRLGK